MPPEIEYLIAKNKLIKDVTGLVLIPEDQLVDHKFNNQDIGRFIPKGYLSGDNCTYCIKYIHNRNPRTTRDKCKGCPMDKANNNCFCSWSTFEAAEKAWNKRATQKDCQKLKQLGEQFLAKKKEEHQLSLRK